MKVSRNTEFVLAAVIIAYIAFSPRMQVPFPPVARALALAGIVYVWKCVSALLAVLLVVAYIRCTSGGVIWEGLAMPAQCTCPEGFTYNAGTGQCKNEAGEVKDPITCQCETGFAYDTVTKECKQSSVMSSPLAPIPETTMQQTPPAPMASAEGAAPAASMGPATSTAPMTTPGAAQAAVGSAPSAPAASSTVTPSTVETFSMEGYPLY